MNVSDPGGEPTIMLRTQRNVVSMDDTVEHEAARGAAIVSSMSSSTLVLGVSGRSALRSGGQNGPQRQMARIVAEEEKNDFEESPLVPTCACLHLLGWQLLTATISHGIVSGYYISSTLLPTPTERLGSCSR